MQNFSKLNFLNFPHQQQKNENTFKRGKNIIKFKFIQFEKIILAILFLVIDDTRIEAML